MNQSAYAKRRYLALAFPFLAVDRWRQEQTAPWPNDAPISFVENVAGALRLIWPDSSALALGLVGGMGLADARAYRPDLVVLDHDPDEDRRLLERIADACDRYTPMVALDPPNGIILDITGCAHLFGGEAGLVADARALIAARGLRVRAALAGSADAARALARYGAGIGPDQSEEEAIRALPIAALELPVKHSTALHRAGLSSIGDLADRPTAPFAARFGSETVAALDRLLIRSDSRITPRRLPGMLVAERRFAEPIGRVDDALGVIEDLLAGLCRRLAERHQGGRRFHVRLYRSDGATQDLVAETGRAVRDPAIVMRLIGERIAALADPIDPGFGFDLIRLAVPATDTLSAEQLALEGGSINREAVVELLDRLGARHGSEDFRRLFPNDSHIPEQAMLTLPMVKQPSTPPSPWHDPDPEDPPLRPIHLFDPPQPVEVVAAVPDGPPHRFRWHRILHQIVRYEGPERISPEWWRRPHDQPGLTRDYFRVEDVRGRRFWLFRHGLYGSERTDPRWYVHGLFA